MNLLKSQASKAGSILLFSAQKNNTLPAFQLIKANKSVAAAYLKYATANTINKLANIYRSAKNLSEGKQPVVKEIPKDTVVIYQFPRGYNIPSLSPYALKLETWCRAAEIKYVNQYGMDRSSQGLIPFIRLNNYVVEDSGKCIDYLSKVFKIDFDSHLTDEQKAKARSVIKLYENSLFWTAVIHRFWFAPNEHLDLHLPRMAYWSFSYTMFSRAWNAGPGRWSREEIYDSGKKDLQALNVILGKNKFLFNNSKPCNADFALFAGTAELQYTDRGPFNFYLNTECKNLVRHLDTMKTLYWPDWDQVILKNRSKNKPPKK